MFSCLQSALIDKDFTSERAYTVTPTMTWNLFRAERYIICTYTYVCSDNADGIRRQDTGQRGCSVRNAEQNPSEGRGYVHVIHDKSCVL